MVELDSQPKSIQSLYGWFSEKKLKVNRRYQRKLVWSLEEKQRLIESVLRKYPVPAVLMAESDDGGYEIIDGLQRLHTIMSFIEGRFPTLDGDYFDISKFPTAQERLESGTFKVDDHSQFLDPKLVGVFLDYTLAVSIMRGASDGEVDDVFGRINTYGHQLSEHERRQAGVQDLFSNTVRTLACRLRGDESQEMLDLAQMPAISVDLPMSKHGYEVRADQVFWVTEGILRSTDLRDSMDEQCLADILACTAGGTLVKRSKEALDQIYTAGTSENRRVVDALAVYGSERAAGEIEVAISEIRRVAAAGDGNLNSVLFSKKNNNGFPALFAALTIAFYEIIFVKQEKISDYAGARAALEDIDTRMALGRGVAKVEERRKNINLIKALLADVVVPEDPPQLTDMVTINGIEARIRRSEIELPNYELKQGFLDLNEKRRRNQDVVERVINTACAMANNGPSTDSAIIIGVADKPAHVAKIQELDGVTPRVIGTRSVVGVNREARVLGKTKEDYFASWKNAFRNSNLSEPLKSDILSAITYDDFFGLGLIVIPIPRQKAVSYVGDKVYV